ncbi:hypothetical protein C0993_006113 [Termitomyces sp. T159_Od127]|nr:hypothetical protein C0993_006113 [Termitomyces sp. T159_Od127]
MDSEIVQFREMLEERIKQRASPLTAIPDEHLPLIVKLAHESDKTLPALTKHIRQGLLPTQDDDEEGDTAAAQVALPLNVVETAIKAVMQRNNYGLDSIGGGKVPAAVCVWRWEVKDQHRDWLPKNAREKAESRLTERVQAKQDLLAIFQSLTQDAKDAILDPKGTTKLPQKEVNVIEYQPTPGDQTPPQSIQKQKREPDGENDSTPKSSTSKPPRAPRPIDPVKALKEQEKSERKAAKAEKEKKKKDAQDKSRSIMANFFSKPKASRTPHKGDVAVAGPSNLTSEFDKTFKPFILKKDTELAPVNWFQESRKLNNKSLPRMHDGVIMIDDEEDDRDVEVTEHSTPTVEDMSQAGRQFCFDILLIAIVTLFLSEHLLSVISSLSSSPNGTLRRHSLPNRDPRLKTYNPLYVRDIVSKLSDAEIEGDDAAVRSLLSQLKDRSLLPAKVLIFAEDRRPGYFGTWTRSSRIIGPRTPFARDVLVFDYGYDSGEEWEDEPSGEADDVNDDAEDEEDDADADSDADSWHVDDDDDVGISLEDMDQLDLPDLPALPSKRKAEDGEKKTAKKRKVVIPLVPYVKGPCWETSVGQSEYSIFDPYRIQMFNGKCITEREERALTFLPDTPLFFDPFTFVSTCVEDCKREAKAAASSNKPILDPDGVFVVPSLPDRLVQSNTTQQASSVASTSSAAASVQSKKAATLKQPFPDQHVPFILQKIATLQTGSFSFLVEAIHRDLREHKVKKNMIEAKIREVGEKCKEKKFWIVKPGNQVPS